MLSRDQILGFQDTDIGSLEVPELGGTVHLASFTAEEMDRVAKHDGSYPASVLAMILGVCDGDGKRVFNDADKAKLMKLPSRVVAKIARAIFTHNGIGPDAEDPKNASGGTGNSGSATD